MKRYRMLSAAAFLALSPMAATAQDDPPTLMEEGLQLFFRGLMDEVEPALREFENLGQSIEPAMRSFLQSMGPALTELLDQVEDWTMYHPPEMLPNGDIILRRRQPDRPSEPTPLPEIEL